MIKQFQIWGLQNPAGLKAGVTSLQAQPLEILIIFYNAYAINIISAVANVYVQFLSLLNILFQKNPSFWFWEMKVFISNERKLWQMIRIFLVTWPQSILDNFQRFFKTLPKDFCLQSQKRIEVFRCAHLGRAAIKDPSQLKNREIILKFL